MKLIEQYRFNKTKTQKRISKRDSSTWKRETMFKDVFMYLLTWHNPLVTTKACILRNRLNNITITCNFIDSLNAMAPNSITRCVWVIWITSSIYTNRINKQTISLTWRDCNSDWFLSGIYIHTLGEGQQMTKIVIHDAVIIRFIVQTPLVDVLARYHSSAKISDFKQQRKWFSAQ
jgi:hypothetical protein